MLPKDWQVIDSPYGNNVAGLGQLYQVTPASTFTRLFEIGSLKRLCA